MTFVAANSISPKCSNGYEEKQTMKPPYKRGEHTPNRNLTDMAQYIFIKLPVHGHKPFCPFFVKHG